MGEHRGEESATRFFGGDEPSAATILTYEETLEVLLSLIGRQVLVLFSSAVGGPFVIGVLSGRLDRGELDERLQEVLLRSDASPVETLFFHVGSRQNGFVLRPDDFERAFRQTEKHLTMHLGDCAVTVFTQGNLGEVMKRDQRATGD
jgi:hypothetical protein